MTLNSRTWKLQKGSLAKSLVVLAATLTLSGTISGSYAQTSTPAPGDKLTGQIERNVTLAEELLNQGRYADAEGLYREALINNPQDMLATSGLGMALAKQFKLDGADDMFNRVLAQDPNNARAHSGKATIMLNRLQSSSGTIIASRDSILKQAEFEAKQGVSMAPSSAEAHYTLGQVYKEQGRIEEAGGEYRTATSLDPQYANAYAQLGMIKLNQNNPIEAADNFKHAIQLNSSNSTAHFGLGSVYLQQGLVDDAIKELNIALYQFPNSQPVHFALGNAYQKQGNSAAAIKEYQMAINIKPEIPDSYLKIAEIREQRGDTEIAVAELRSGLAQLPYNVDLRLHIAQNLLKLEKSDDAIKNYKTILSMSPGNTSAIKGLTQALCQKAQKAAVGAMLSSNDYDSALKSLDEAIKLSPNDLELRLAQAKMMSLAGAKPDLSKMGQPTTDGERLVYADALTIQGEYKKADEQFEVVLSRVSDAKQVFAVADMAVMIKNLDSAEAAYKKALTFDGSADRAQRGMAAVQRLKQTAVEDVRVGQELFKKRLYDGAADRFKHSIATNPELAEAHLGLAQSLEKLPKASDTILRAAAQEYRLYLALGPALSPRDIERYQRTAIRLDDRAAKLVAQGRRG